MCKWTGRLASGRRFSMIWRVDGLVSGVTEMLLAENTEWATMFNGGCSLMAGPNVHDMYTILDSRSLVCVHYRVFRYIHIIYTYQMAKIIHRGGYLLRDFAIRRTLGVWCGCCSLHFANGHIDWKCIIFILWEIYWKGFTADLLGIE